MLGDLAREYSPRAEMYGDTQVVLDARGLEKLFGDARALGEMLRRAAADRGLCVRVAVAATHTAARLAVLGRAGLMVIPPGREAAALAPLPLDVLGAFVSESQPQALRVTLHSSLVTLKRWGLRTLGDLAALPAADLYERLGAIGPRLQRLARGEDERPLVPEPFDEPLEASLALEWPIEGLEPLSFVLGRLFEPLCARLERAEAGAVKVHVHLRLVTRETYARTLQWPVPIRDPRVLRTLVLLDLKGHPPPFDELCALRRAQGEQLARGGSLNAEGARVRGRRGLVGVGVDETGGTPGIDAVTVRIEATRGRVLQFSLLERALPAPEQLSTLLARLTTLMGEGHCGTPVPVDSNRPGAFAMQPFDPHHSFLSPQSSVLSPRPFGFPVPDPRPPVSVLRRCRVLVLARVTVERGRPVHVRMDAPISSGGWVMAWAGPWRTSGEWWTSGAEDPALGAGRPNPESPIPNPEKWDRDEWDVALSDGGVYRLSRDRERDRWVVDGIVD